MSTLFQPVCGPSSFATTLRLMAGQELATEGFQKGQVGSSAMPHKMNSRSSERINGFRHILAGYVTMVSGIAGDQWNEGDVSCSVVRRVALAIRHPTCSTWFSTSTSSTPFTWMCPNPPPNCCD